MPNVESAKKALRQSIKRRERNRAQRANLRTLLKKVNVAADAGDAKAIEATLVPAFKALGKSGKTNLIHHKKASRLTSRLQKRVNKALAKAPQA